MSKSANLYMHTMGGRPAYYVPGEQIYYLSSYGRKKASEMFVGSLDEIKEQQAKSTEWRKKRGFDDATPADYGYIRIRDDINAGE